MYQLFMLQSNFYTYLCNDTLITNNNIKLPLCFKNNIQSGKCSSTRNHLLQYDISQILKKCFTTVFSNQAFIIYFNTKSFAFLNLVMIPPIL